MLEYVVLNWTGSSIWGSFDTEEEARNEVERLIAQPSFTDRSFVVARRIATNNPVRVWE